MPKASLLLQKAAKESPLLSTGEQGVSLKKEITLQTTDELDRVIKNSRNRFFPINLPENITARCVSSDELFEVFNKYVSEVFIPGSFDSAAIDEGLKSRAKKLAPLRSRYKTLHSEYILFFDEFEAPVGWMFGETHYENTFYMRNTGFLKNYQNKGIYSAFLKRFLEYLKSIGYEKVTSHHLGTNKAALIPKLKIGFDICGLKLHEIFGANVKLVYMFHDDRKSAYHQKYGK